MRDKSLRSGERQVACGLTGIESWHLWRYYETLPYINGETVLDVGCGVGYGSYIMSQKANGVYAIDDSQETIEFARAQYGRPNILFAICDLLELADNVHPDLVVAYEVIEHIENIQEVFNKFKVINPNLFIVSTPHLKCPVGGNQFHHRHYGMDELIDRFWDIGYQPERAELLYFGKGLCNFLIAKRR